MVNIGDCSEGVELDFPRIPEWDEDMLHSLRVILSFGRACVVGERSPISLLDFGIAADTASSLTGWYILTPPGERDDEGKRTLRAALAEFDASRRRFGRKARGLEFLSGRFHEYSGNPPKAADRMRAGEEALALSLAGRLCDVVWRHRKERFRAVGCAR